MQKKRQLEIATVRFIESIELMESFLLEGIFCLGVNDSFTCDSSSLQSCQWLCILGGNEYGNGCQCYQKVQRENCSKSKRALPLTCSVNLELSLIIQNSKRNTRAQK